MGIAKDIIKKCLFSSINVRGEIICTKLNENGRTYTFPKCPILTYLVSLSNKDMVYKNKMSFKTAWALIVHFNHIKYSYECIKEVYPDKKNEWLPDVIIYKNTDDIDE